MNLLKEFINHIQKENLFEPQHRLLVAVSGGVDSMVLLYLLFQSGYQIHVAHANFNLRGNDSNNDEECVKRFCLENKITLYVKHFNTQLSVLTTGLGLQETARNLRYEWFNQLLIDEHFDYILTAHHANDLAETILFNLIRGSGLNGLAGIKNKSTQLIRPLLFASKEQLLFFADLNNITFRNDSSNDKDVYTRNYIRHHLMPHILKLNPSFISQVPHFSNRMLANAFYYEKGLQHTILNLLKKVGDITVINLQRLILEPYPEHILFEMIHTMGFNFSNCKQVIKSYKKHNTGALFFTQSHKALINRHEFIIKLKANKNIYIEIDQLPFSFIYKKDELNFNLQHNHQQLSFNPDSIYVNADLLLFPLTLRNIKPGDKITPLGMLHSKKISDYLTDKKVDRFSKEDALVVLQKTDQLIALIPYQIAESFKIVSGCKNVLQITIKKGS